MSDAEKSADEAAAPSATAAPEVAPRLDPLAAEAPKPVALSKTPATSAISAKPASVKIASAKPSPPAKHVVAEENAFLGEVGRAVLGAGLGGLAAHIVLGGVNGSAWSFGFAIAGALASVGLARGVGRAIQGGIVGGFGAMLYGLSVPEWPVLGALLMGAACAPVLARGESGAKLAATGALTGVLAVLGAYVAARLGGTGVLHALVPPFLASSAAGAALGLFIGLGAVPRYIAAGEEPVEAAYARSLAKSSGEVQEILERSLTIYRAIREDLEGRRGGKTEAALTSRVSDLALRILKIGESCRAIERDLGAAPAEALEERIAALRQKAEAAHDPAAKATFLSTIGSLDSQKQAIEAIGRGLERVVARLHANVALLEKVRFSLVHARSADAERSDSEASPLTETIDELSRELDATTMAVGEVYGKNPAA